MPAAFDASSALGAAGRVASRIAIAISWIRIIFKLRSRKKKRVHTDPLACSRTRLPPRLIVLVYYRDADVLVSVHLFENLIYAVETAGPGDHRLRRDFLRFDQLQHRGVVRRLHPERSDQLKVHRDDPIDRHRNLALLRLSRETNLHMTSLLAKTHDRVAAG